VVASPATGGDERAEVDCGRLDAQAEKDSDASIRMRARDRQGGVDHDGSPPRSAPCCRRMIRHVEAPIACSPSMNSRSRSDMNVAPDEPREVRPEQQGEQQPDEQLTVRLLC